MSLPRNFRIDRQQPPEKATVYQQHQKENSHGLLGALKDANGENETTESVHPNGGANVSRTGLAGGHAHITNEPQQD